MIGEEYEKDGQKKMKWNPIGKIFVSREGKEYAKLYMIPNALLHVFEDKPREEKSNTFAPEDVDLDF